MDRDEHSVLTPEQQELYDAFQKGPDEFFDKIEAYEDFPERLLEVFDTQDDGMADDIADEIIHESDNMRQFKEDFEKFTGGKVFSSIEEQNAELHKFNEIRNNTGLDDFLGLSPSQMFNLQKHKPFAKGSGLELNDEVDVQLIKNTPVIRFAEFILNCLKDAGKVKATAAKKNLPRQFARDFHKFYIKERYNEDGGRGISSIQSEDDTPILFLLRMVLARCGYLKFSKGYFSLTGKGQRIIETGFANKEFRELMIFYIQEVHWGFTDRYPEAFEVQQHVCFLLYVIQKQPDGFFPADEIGKAMLRAFPMVADSFADHPYFGGHINETVCGICERRLVDHFGYLFGLMEAELRPNKDEVYKKDTFCRKSDLFKKLFIWTVGTSIG